MRTIGQTNSRLAKLLAGCLLTAAVLAGCGSSPSKEDRATDSPMADAMMNSSAAKQAAGSAAVAPAAQTAANAESMEKPKQQAAPATSGAAAPAPSQGAAIAPGAEPTSGRQIVYKANVAMEVAEYGAAHTEINNLIHVSGGYLLQFSENRTDYEQSGTLVVKVPAKRFADFLADLEKMKPKTIQRSVQGQDVTEEYVDLESRLKSKQTEEARLLDFMAKATKSEDLVAFSSQVGKVQTDIEQLKGRMRYLEQNVAFSTVEIRLYQKLEKAKAQAKEPEQPFAGRLSKAMNGSIGVLSDVVQGLLIVLAGALPVLAVLALAAVPVWLALRVRRRRTMEREAHSREIRRQNRQPGESNDAGRETDENPENPQRSNE